MPKTKVEKPVFEVLLPATTSSVFPHRQKTRQPFEPAGLHDRKKKEKKKENGVG